MSTKTYYLSKEQIGEGIDLCLKKVQQILNDVEILCQNDGDETSAVYLYTVAVEEFGKSLLLEECLNNPPEPKGIPVSTNLFTGLKAHELKFSKAFHELPDECVGYYNVNPWDEKHKIPSEYKERLRDVMKAQESLKKLEKKWPNVEFRVESMELGFDFPIRKTLLYVNWDPVNEIWNKDVTISPYKTILDDNWEDQEVEKDEDEVYPEKILQAVKSFRDFLTKRTD